VTDLGVRLGAPDHRHCFRFRVGKFFDLEVVWDGRFLPCLSLPVEKIVLRLEWCMFLSGLSLSAEMSVLRLGEKYDVE